MKNSILFFSFCFLSMCFGYVVARHKIFPYWHLEKIKKQLTREKVSIKNYVHPGGVKHVNWKYSRSGPNLALMGDSIVEFGSFSNHLIFSRVYNLGKNGDTTSDVLFKISDAIKLNPKNLVLWFGVNDLRTNISEELAIKNYTEILYRLSETKINAVVISVLDCSSGDNHKHDASFPCTDLLDRIRSLNKKIQKLCFEYKVDFIDINKLMSEKNGMPTDYTIDNIHLSPKGYMRLYEILNEQLKI